MGSGYCDKAGPRLKCLQVPVPERGHRLFNGEEHPFASQALRHGRTLHEFQHLGVERGKPKLRTLFTQPHFGLDRV